MANPFQRPRGKQCMLCEKVFVALWARQQYCESCQDVRKSTLRHQSVQKDSAAKTAAYLAVAESSSKERRSLPGAFERPDYDWTVSFKVPFTISASKNRRWSQMAGGRGVFIPVDVLNYTQLISLQTRKALEGRHVYENRVWLSFFVQKPDHKSDAVNIVDTFCDAIKTVVGVDDRWFSIDVLDWEIRKHEPQVYVRIGQADCFDARACSYCGGIFPLDNFHKSKHNRLGVGRECRECKGVVAAKRKELSQ